MADWSQGPELKSRRARGDMPIVLQSRSDSLKQIQQKWETVLLELHRDR